MIGRQLVPLLGSVGHDVIAPSRTPGRAAAAPAAGVSVVAADALDATAMTRVMRQAAPDAVVNLLTAIPASIDPKHFARDFALTNLLRTHGTRNLLDAADDIGAGVIVSEGLAFAYDPREATLADEDAPLWVDPPAPFAPARDALIELEQRTRASGGLVLRFGHLYGPATSYAAGGSFTDQIRRRKVPIVGGGKATFSFIHTYDAATAILAALDRRTGGTLNIVDDDPAPVREWLPYLAEVLGAPAPRSAPAVLARLAAGAWGVAFMTRLRGADNARARLVLDWRPRYASWRDGFAAELGMDSAPANIANLDEAMLPIRHHIQSSEGENRS